MSFIVWPLVLLIVAALSFYLLNKYLDQRQLEINLRNSINNGAADAALAVAAKELHKQFDERINKTWETIAITKTELESLKLQLAIKGK